MFSHFPRWAFPIAHLPIWQAKKSNGEGLDTEELRLVKELGAAVAPAKGDKALEAPTVYP